MIKSSTLILMLRISICCGICLILLGIYLHNFNHTVEAMGIKGIILSAMCVAFGMILSLPTKMYLTLLLVNHENHQRELEHSHQQHSHTHSNQIQNKTNTNTNTNTKDTINTSSNTTSNTTNNTNTTTNKN